MHLPKTAPEHIDADFCSITIADAIHCLLINVGACYSNNILYYLIVKYINLYFNKLPIKSGLVTLYKQPIICCKCATINKKAKKDRNGNKNRRI